MTSDLDDFAADKPTGASLAQMLPTIGNHYRVDDYYEVSREKVREFARSVQDYHPAHWDEGAAAEYGYDGLLAPLTFISMVGILAQDRFFDALMPGYDVSQVLQTDQNLEFYRPIKVGDRLTCDVYLQSFRQAFGGDLIGTKNIVTDQNDEVVLVGRTSLAGRSGGATEAQNIVEAALRILRNDMGIGKTDVVRRRTATSPRPHKSVGLEIDPIRFARSFESVTVGEQLPPRTVQLTRGDLVNYAGVSGDANPIHWSTEMVELAGLDDCVAHGMLTMGIGAGFVTSWLGDPGAVKEYNVRMTSPVYVAADKPGEIEYTGKVKSIDEQQRTAVVAITAVHGGKKIFGRATATVQLS